MSKRSKRKNKALAKAQQANIHAEKAYIGGGYSSFYYGGGTTPDMRPDEYGAALAYTFNAAVSAAINFWELWLDGIQWAIKREGSDEVIVSSDMRRYPREVQGAKFAHAVKHHEQTFKHSLFKSMAFSDMMYGETYVRFLCNDFKIAQLLEWLNPLAVEPDITMGYIRNYRYNAADGSDVFSPKEVAYRIAKRNSQNDLRGQSRVLTVIDELNLTATEKRSLKNYFKNNMQLGGVISPTSNETSLAPNQIMKMEDDLARNNKGAMNAGKWVIAPTNMNFNPFPATDIEKNYNIIKPLRDEILMAMGVYPQLVGDPSQANYDNTADMKRQWWETYGIPYAKEIMGYINDLILPVLEPYTAIYFEFDFTPYEVESPEIVEADLSAGMIDIYSAQEKRGYEGDEDLKGIYMINNVPMSKAIILKLAHTVPSQYALDYANAATAGQAPNMNADRQGIVSPINPSLPSGETPIENEAISEIRTHYLSKKSTDGTPTLDDGSPIVEPPFPATLNSIHDGIPDDIHHSHGLNHGVVSVIATKSDTPSELDELSAWRKFVTNGKSQKRSFEQKALRGDIGDLVQLAIDSKDRQAVLDAFKTAQERIEARVKAIQATRLDFESDFDSLLKRARDERFNRQSWSSAMRSIMRRFGRRAYIDGMADGGVEDEPSEDDNIRINELSSEQSQYVTELGNVLFREDGVTDAVADIKAAMWFNKSVYGFYEAGLLSADANGLYEWVYGDTEHCETCRRLNGQRHRLKGWKANVMPKSAELDCGGWLCACNLVKVKGRQRGNY